MALAAVAMAGCGAKRPRPEALLLERNDLAVLSRTLERLEAPIGREVAAARTLWPALNGGLPRGAVPATMQLGIATADARAQAVTPPAFVTKPGLLTGPAAAIGGLLKDYAALTQRGWRLTAAASAADPRGSASSAAPARFVRANAGLYIYSVYDGHFDLSLVGKAVRDAYRDLGGPAAFGRTLTQAEVEGLARAYAPDSVRLEPHPPPSLEV